MTGGVDWGVLEVVSAVMEATPVSVCVIAVCRTTQVASIAVLRWSVLSKVRVIADHARSSLHGRGLSVNADFGWIEFLSEFIVVSLARAGLWLSTGDDCSSSWVSGSVLFYLGVESQLVLGFH